MNPLSAVYGALTRARNSLYDAGTLRTRTLAKPVISVGNLSAGGTGKTPFVIALGEMLKQRGIHVDVLSRGYGRKTKGVLIVDANGDARDFGDEPLLIAQKLGVPVVLGERRYAAGIRAEQEYPDSQVHLLDDGFQHRSLARQLDLVLLADGDLNDTLLPGGRLREPVANLKRADVIVVGEAFEAATISTLRKPLIRTRRVMDLSAARQLNSPIAFCGLARPAQFFQGLRDAGITPAREVTFRDHRDYTRADVEHLFELRGTCNADGFITTEKDAVKLGAFRHRLQPFAVVPLTTEIVDSTGLWSLIHERLGL
jgi:tetraacyldisaccharide 4'-kinase